MTIRLGSASRTISPLAVDAVLNLGPPPTRQNGSSFDLPQPPDICGTGATKTFATMVLRSQR